MTRDANRDAAIFIFDDFCFDMPCYRLFTRYCCFRFYFVRCLLRRAPMPTRAAATPPHLKFFLSFHFFGADAAISLDFDVSLCCCAKSAGKLLITRKDAEIKKKKKSDAMPPLFCHFRRHCFRRRRLLFRLLTLDGRYAACAASFPLFSSAAAIHCRSPLLHAILCAFIISLSSSSFFISLRFAFIAAIFIFIMPLHFHASMPACLRRRLLSILRRFRYFDALRAPCYAFEAFLLCATVSLARCASAQRDAPRYARLFATLHFLADYSIAAASRQRFSPAAAAFFFFILLLFFDFITPFFAGFH